MQEKEELYNELLTAKDKVQIDECVKRIISQKGVLARILKATASEFRKFSIEDIEKMIEPDIEISHTPLRPFYKIIPSHSDKRILGDNTEDKVPGEGMNFYDIRFHVYLPKQHKKIPIKLLINIEAQADFYKKYHFVTRGIFYGARMISAQLGTEFTNSRYDKIKKVYSIWICMNSPKKIGNVMAEFSIQKKNIIGKLHDGRKHYDKLSVIIICLNEKAVQQERGIHEFLNLLFSQKLPIKEKQKQLENKFNLKLSKQAGKEVNDMCNVGEAIERKGIRKGKHELNRLNKYLIRDGRLEDLIKATTDSDYQDKLLKEYGFNVS